MRKNDVSLNELTYATHLRWSMNKPMFALQLLLYFILAVIGVLMSVFTNAIGVKYDSEGGELYRHPYRVQIEESLIGRVTPNNKYKIYDFTKTLPNNAYLDTYDYDSLEILNADNDNSEVYMGYPEAYVDSRASDTLSLYFPSSGLKEFNVTKTITSTNITKPTIFLPSSYYDEYNRTFEAINSSMIDGVFSVSKNYLGTIKGVLSQETITYDLLLDINDKSLSTLGITSPTVDLEVKVSIIVNDVKVDLETKIIDGETTFNFETFSRLGQNMRIGKTLVFSNLKDAYQTRNNLKSYEDVYSSFNNSDSFDTPYASLYNELAYGLIGIYAIIVTMIFIISRTNRKSMTSLDKLGFPFSISSRSYSWSTLILAFLASAFGVLILITLYNFMSGLGAMIWFNFFDGIMIVLIEFLIGGLDVFVATRRR